MNEHEPIEENDIERILDSKAFANKNQLRNQTVFVLQISTGAHVDELRKLGRFDVIDANGNLRPEIVLVHEKTGKPRIVCPIREQLIRRFLPEWLRRLDAQLLFPPLGDRPLITRHGFNKLYMKALKELDLFGTYDSYSIKAAWANQYRRLLVDYAKETKNTHPFFVSETLRDAGGWKSIGTMYGYLKLRKPTRDDLREAAKNIFQGSLPKVRERGLA